MNFEMLAVVMISLSAGAGMMFFRQRSCRKRELKRLEKLTYDILNERRIQAGAAGE